MNNHVVIMAGGIRSRLWPLSTPECPKQVAEVMGLQGYIVADKGDTL
ncbi:MAG: hypothetical protein ACRCUJ_02395 [Phocaeicola sp.]